MLVFQGEGHDPFAERMTHVRSDSDRALLRMTPEYTSQQASQNRLLLILSRAGMDGEQPVPATHIVCECRLHIICHPAGSICGGDIVRFSEDHQPICRHEVGR